LKAVLTKLNYLINLKPNKKINFFTIKKNIIRDKWLYILLIPFIIWYLVFAYKPMLSLKIAFQDFSLFQGVNGSRWIGFDNFKEYLTGPYFFRNLSNTFIINIYSLVFAFPAPIILAILMNEAKNKLFKKTIQTVTYLPHFISIVIIAGIVTNFLAPSNGLVNIIIDKLGGQKEYFLTKPEYFRSIFTSMNMWKETGFNTIIFIAALTGIDQELYEAVAIDGANKWRQIIHVTIPGILPTIIIMFILKIGSLLDVGYEAIILLYQPVTYKTADVISTYVYRTGLQEANYGLAAAVGLFNSVVALILVYTANRLSRKFSETSLW
jgi:putative aldouronate transport system permease protein